MISAVKRNVNAPARPCVQQSLAHRIFAHHPHKIAVANAVHRFLPALPKVARPKNMRTQIVETVSIDRRIGGTGFEMRRFDDADRAPLRYARRSDVLPRHAAIVRQLDVPIICSNPDDTFLDPRRRDRQDRAKHLFRIFFIGARTRQFRTHSLPACSSIRRFQKKLRTEIDQTWILRRKKQWNRPVETVLAAKRDRRRGNIPHLSRRFGHSHHAPGRPGVVHHIRVQRIWNRIAAFSRTNRIPVALRDLSVVSAAGDARRSAVLLRSVHPVGKSVIRRDPIKLSRRLVVPRAPGLATVEADRRALIDTEHDALRIRRIDPHRVVIVAARRTLDGREVVPAVVRTVQVLRRHIHHIGILRIDENLAHVPEAGDAPVFRGSFASTIKYTRWPRVPGATATPDRPQSVAGSPCPAIGVHVSPSSDDLYSPLPGPYAVPFCPGFRMPCHSVAYTTRGFPGSKQRSTAPVSLFLNKTFFHVRPPSADRNTPRSSFGPKACPIAATSTRSGLRGSIRLLPRCLVSSSPRCCYVSPACVYL